MLAVRLSLPFLALFGITALYWILHLTIVVSGTKKLDSTNLGDISFIRVMKETKVEKKQRVKKELPKIKKIKTPPKQVVSKVKPNIKMDQPKLDINIPLVNLPVNIENSNFLKGAVALNPSMGNSNIIPILKVPTVYPRRARMLKKEGFVKLKLTVSKEGLVSKAVIIDSKPKKIFDKAALDSVYRWKFKPKMIDGKPMEQVGIQVLDFKLR